MTNAVSLFSPFLEEGSKGGAVTALHIFLCTLGLGEEIKFDGEYGPKTVRAVQHLQRERLMFTGKDVDGKFGPGTREACVKKLEWSPHLVPFEVLPVKTTWICEGQAGEQTEPAIWPPED